jgi:glycosyltransferase involved in cell wall biosynthesis
MRLETGSTFRGQGAALICFSHLRWNFVYQRPQHLLSRAARRTRVVFFEEPIFGSENASLEITETPSGIVIAVPQLPHGGGPGDAERQQRQMLDNLLDSQHLSHLTFWYYTPMSLAFSDHVEPDVCVYDCMDELSAFRFAPEAMATREKQLLDRCDLVFTGGESLFEAKRQCHPNIHCFPSSIDKAHFVRARRMGSHAEPEDQAVIPPRRVGFFGVIDERMDLELVANMAAAAPNLQIVMVGPVVKVDPADLPRAPNIHWLGPKQYEELPSYLAGWDCGIMPFAINESTRFISPTKTPEFLCAGLPLVSTDIADVRRPYGELGLVSIARNATEFLDSIQAAIGRRNDAERLERTDRFLSDKSWDVTFARMFALIDAGPSQKTDMVPEFFGHEKEVAI